MGVVEIGVPGDTDHRIVAAVPPFALGLEPLYRWRMLLASMDAGGQAWTFKAEIRALEALRSLVSEQQFLLYVTLGAFPEVSKGSQAAYVFRRARPTIAMLRSASGDYYPSVALCLHAVAYYEKTFAGGLVPTDDVIAHLMWMRSDEHGYWRRANQHGLDRIEAGI